MPSRPTLAVRAKQLLTQAAGRLGTVSPLEDVGPVIDQSLGVGLDEAYDETPLSANFSEQSPDQLNFVMRATGPGVTPADRIGSASSALSRIVAQRFGAPAERWVRNRLEPVVSLDNGRSASWGAAFGSAYDRNGLAESYMHCEWGPTLMDALPAPLYRVARLALESMPGLRPAISTVRCGRTAGSQQVSFEVERPLPLANLQPLMDQLGLAHRHAGLMSAVAFILGARFVLPPEAAMITLRPMRVGVEMRLDVNLDAIPDLPAQLMALMRMQMTERPTHVQGLDRWLMALTPDGYPGPGTVSVLSVWVRPDLPARIALYLRPASLGPAPDVRAPAPPLAAPSPSVAASGLEAMQGWSSSAWLPPAA
jgi:hypothetical protein